VRELAPGDRPKDWVERAGAVPEGERGELPEARRVADPDCETMTSPERFKVQFTASQEDVDLLNRARDLLSHAVPDRSLGEVHLRALRLLVEQLERRKYGAPRPNTPAASPKASTSKNCAHAPRRSGTAAVRREVRDRDGMQCTYVDERGERCRETRFLELHHELAHALGGAAVAKNLRMRCQAHNALAAEQDFGRDFVEECRTSAGRSPPRP